MRTTLWTTTCVGLCLALLTGAGSAASPDEHGKETSGTRDADGRGAGGLQSLKETLAMDYAKLQKEIRDQTNLVDVTPAAVRQLIDRLQEQGEQLRLDEAGAHARENALQEALNRATDQMRSQAANDDVSKELQAVVSAREAQLDRLMKMREAVSRDTIDQAQAELASAKAQLAASRQSIRNGPAAASVERWNQALLESSVASGERRARLRYIEDRLRQFSTVVDQVDRLSELQADLAELRRTSPIVPTSPGAPEPAGGK